MMSLKPNHALILKRITLPIYHLIAIVAAVALISAACGGNDESLSRLVNVESAEYRTLLSVEDGRPGPPGAPGATAIPMPASTPVPAAMMERETRKEVESGALAVSDSVFGDPSDDSAASRREIAARQTERIIVRDAEMRIEAEDPADVVKNIGDLANRLGGWVVDSEAAEGSFFTITVRVPADQLDAAIEEVQRQSTKVLNNSTNSRDFTEEYIDLNARIGTLSTTRDALQELLRDSELADDLQQVLEVRREITDIESQLESLEGRLRFITQSAAFSKLTVHVEASPRPMVVDAGEEMRTPLGHGSQFTARFFPPEGYDRFRIEWDFGDGSGIHLQERAIRTGDADGAYLTAPVVYTYHDDQYSPYAVTVKVTAYSENKVAKGEDQLWVHAAELPQLNIFVGDYEEAAPGETISFRATFDDHIDVEDLNYEWNFGDGSAPVSGVVKDGITAVDANHAFERHQNRSYRVNFELSGDSVAGEIRQSAEMSVFITEPPTVDESAFEPAGSATQGINAVIAVASFAGNAIIWIGVTIPIWIAIVVVGYVIYRVIGWWRRRLLQGDDGPSPEPVTGSNPVAEHQTSE